jgi:hypothetical protein
MLGLRRMLWALWLGAAVVGRLGHTPAVLAQIAVSANDNKLMLVNGAATVVLNPAPDTVVIIDLKQFPPEILADLEAPASVVGPPHRQGTYTGQCYRRGHAQGLGGV